MVAAGKGGDVALKVLGLAGGMLTMFNLLDSEMPSEQTSPYDSTVRVAVALNNGFKHFKDADGSSPMILAFNENGQHIGNSYRSEVEHIPSGSFKDVIVHQDQGLGQQATTLQVCGLTDAVCVAYLSQTWADGTNRAWLGDMAKECGSDWYYSNIIVGDNGHKPACAWIDEDHTNDISKAAMQIHMQNFTQLDDQAKPTTDPGALCSLPAMLFKDDHNYKFGKHSNVITNAQFGRKPDELVLWTGNIGSWDWPERAHRKRLNKRPFVHLVASVHDKHSAKALCESDTSHGPDFVSHRERIFCDMSTKMHWPLCAEGDKVQSDCYHWGTHSLVSGIGRRERGYSHVETWD